MILWGETWQPQEQIKASNSELSSAVESVEWVLPDSHSLSQTQFFD